MIKVSARRSEGIGVKRFLHLDARESKISRSVCDASDQGWSIPAMRVDSRLPVRIAVASKESSPHAADSRWVEFSGLLPPGSEIRQLCGSAHRCRIAGRAEPWLNAAGLESWFREWKPDVLYFPRLADLGFGILPLAWQEALRISLRHVLVNAVRPPSTVHERLLVREAMMAVGGFWPGVPDGRESPLGSNLSGGLNWLVQGNRGAGELLRWKPRRAVEPRMTVVDGVFDESGRIECPTGLATLLLGDPPFGVNDLSGRGQTPTVARHGPEGSRIGSRGLWLPSHERRDCLSSGR